jgi:hypothetical protein
MLFGIKGEIKLCATHKAGSTSNPYSPVREQNTVKKEKHNTCIFALTRDKKLFSRRLFENEIGNVLPVLQQSIS